MTLNSLQDYVVDASVVVAYVVQNDTHHAGVRTYWDDLERGQCRFHIPMLGVVETTGVVHRRSSLSDALVVFSRLQQLTETGHLVQYPLDEERSQMAVTAALQHRLRGADAVYAALAEELKLEKFTADRDFRSHPRVVDLSGGP